ncbi:MAG: tetratricopeptide repeat protein [Pyrinomonadaceae bacterium]
MKLRSLQMILATLFFGLTPFYIFSQIAGGADESTRTDFNGKNYILGMVILPSGLQVTSRIRIRLSSLTAGEVITTTDDRGRFNFTKIRNGTYTLTVDGEEDFETTSEQIEVALPGGAQSQTFNVTLRLRAKRNQLEKPAVIRTENAGVPKRAMEHYAKGLELSKVGDHLGAVEQLKLAVEAYPEFMVAMTEIGVQFAMLNELEKADNALQSALKIKSDAFEPLINRGIVLVRLKRYAEAEVLLRDAVKAKELSPVAHLFLGRALAAQKKYDDAEKELSLAITIGAAEMKEAHRILASIYLEKEEYIFAAKELEIYLTLNPDAPDAESLQKTLKQLKGTATSTNKP